MVELFKALGDDNRLRIMNLLTRKELCVCEIETLLEMTQSNVSRHLSKLKTSGIIGSSKDGQWVHYFISEDFIEYNGILFEYLMEQFKLNELFIEDTEKYERYKEQGLSCQSIKADKEEVLSLIRN